MTDRALAALSTLHSALCTQHSASRLFCPVSETAPDKPKLPPEVKRLGWVSFFADVSSEMAYPILPLFLTLIGAPKIALGAIEGASEALVSFSKVGSGFLSDRSGKRTPWIRLGYTLSAFGKPLIGLAHVWPTVLGARLLDRFGKGLRTTPRDALITDVTDKAIRGRAFGFHSTMDTAGALLGVVFTYLLVWYFAGTALSTETGYRWIFGLALIPGLVAVAITFLVREPAVHREETSLLATGSPPNVGVPGAVSQPGRLKLSELPRGYWRAMIVTVIFAVGNSSDTFVLLRAKDFGLSAGNVVLAYALYNVTYMLMAYPAGILSDKIGRWWLLGSGWVLFALTYFGLAYLGVGYLWPLLALYGVCMGLTQGVSKALVADHAPSHAKGTALGLFYFVMGFAVLGASLLAGWLWDRFGASATFGFGAGAAVVAVLAIPLTAWMERPVARQS